MPKTSHTTKTYENLLLAIKNKGLKITTAKTGLSIDAGAAIEAQMVAHNSESYDNLNNYSAVLRVKYGNNSFLFTGDAEAASEVEMINSGYTIKSDVLKVDNTRPLKQVMILAKYVRHMRRFGGKTFYSYNRSI